MIFGVRFRLRPMAVWAGRGLRGAPRVGKTLRGAGEDRRARVKDIIDLNGASGGVYRFRLWRPGSGHLPMAGNYVDVQAAPGGFAVLAAAAVDDLSRVRPAAGGTEAAEPVHLFTRLNVSRAVRQAEAEDIAAFYGLDPEASASQRAG